MALALRIALVVSFAWAGCTLASSGLPSPSADKSDGTGEARCELSRLGQAVYEAAYQAPRTSPVPSDLIVTYDNQAELPLIDAGRIFPALAQLIVNSNESIDIATYEWWLDSDASDVLFAALDELQERVRGQGAKPIEVRLLVARRAVYNGNSDVEALAREIASRRYDSSLVHVIVASRSASGLGVMHQKQAIIDGKIVHIGGANVQGVNDWKLGAVPWRDSAYVLRGEVAGAVAADFDALWAEGRTWSCNGDDCDSYPNDPVVPGPRLAEPMGACTPMIALGRRAQGLLNNSVDNPQDAGFLKAIGRAQEVVKIFTPNLNDDAVKTAILNTIRRAVNVQIILSKGFNESAESLPGQGGSNQDTMEELYEEAIFEHGWERACELLQIRWYARPGRGAVEGNVPGASHLKYTSVDSQLVIVGSANMDTQSWNHSGEMNIAIDDVGVASEYDARVFDPSFAQAETTNPCVL